MIVVGSIIWRGIDLVPEAGLEPAQGCPYPILSPLRVSPNIWKY